MRVLVVFLKTVKTRDPPLVFRILGALRGQPEPPPGETEDEAAAAGVGPGAAELGARLDALEAGRRVRKHTPRAPRHDSCSVLKTTRLLAVPCTPGRYPMVPGMRERSTRIR